MNIVRISQLLKQSGLLLAVLGSSILLSACGGGSSNKTTASSSSISSTVSSHIFSSASVTPTGTGTWESVKVTSNHNRTLKFEWSAVDGATYYKLMKKADSNSSFVQVGSDITTTTATDTVSVHLTDWLNSRYRIDACDDTGCNKQTAEIVTDSAMLSAISYIKASNAEAGDWFGWSVAISGDGQTMAVGAPAEGSAAVGVNGDKTNNDSPTSGAVYVFTKVDGAWQEQAYLKASNTSQKRTDIDLTLNNARFGYQVALSADGNTLAVSAINENSPSAGIGCDQGDYAVSSSFSSMSSPPNSVGYVIVHREFHIGAVYMFKREASTWSQTTYIKPFNPDKNFGFGGVLSLSGDGKTLAVGVPVEATYYGSMLVSDNTSSVACVNYSLSSVSSSSVSSTSSSSSSATSSNSNSSSSIPGGPNSGAVYVYRLTDAGWKENVFIKPTDSGIDDLFGTSVSLSQDGNTLAVGATGEDSPDSTAMNALVTINGEQYNLNCGTVYVFTYRSDAWSQTAKLKPSNIVNDQEFGASVALAADGNTLAVGTPADWSTDKGINPDGTKYDVTNSSTIQSGAVYIFNRAGDAWNQQVYLKASNAAPGYRFGDNVALSSNGDILAVGSWLESSRATGINGDSADSSAAHSGATYLFTRTGNNWLQKSYIKAPNTTANDRFARAFGLDFSGDTLLIGAYRESGTATGINGDQSAISANSASGAVYIY